MKQKLKDLDAILTAMDSVKNSTTNPYKKTNEVVTRKGLSHEYYIDIENILIADGYAAINKTTYSQGVINQLGITHSGFKFISKGGYIIERKKDNAFKTDLPFKIITAILAAVAIVLTIWTKILDDKYTRDKKELTDKVEALEKDNIKLQTQFNDLQKKQLLLK